MILTIKNQCFVIKEINAIQNSYSFRIAGFSEAKNIIVPLRYEQLLRATLRQVIVFWVLFIVIFTLLLGWSVVWRRLEKEHHWPSPSSIERKQISQFSRGLDTVLQRCAYLGLKLVIFCVDIAIFACISSFVYYEVITHRGIDWKWIITVHLT